MNKQEAIEFVENISYSVPINSSLKYLREETVVDIIKQLDEPEKPVVPQCVADMIVKRKKQGDSLVATLVNLGAFGDAQRWIRKGDNGDTFAKAWLFGYEVEKEKLYTVEIPNPNGGTYLALCKDVDGKLFFDVFFSEEWKTFGKCKLTESEIKKDFEWAWQFAKEVEND